MIRVIDAGEVEIFSDEQGKYCNNCRFRVYRNHEMKHWCVLFMKKLEKDGYNFIRLAICHLLDKGAKYG